jgi:hypothetical protein
MLFVETRKSRNQLKQMLNTSYVFQIIRSKKFLTKNSILIVRQVSSGLVESNENTAFSSILPETSKSPRQLGHHLDIEGALLHEDQSSFGAQSSSQKMHQSLTEQLKTDLGLGTTPNSFGNSKKFHEPLHQNKAVKAGVVEFLSGDAPAISSGEWQFGFDATPLPQSSVSDDHQFRRDNVSKMNEPARNDVS